MQSLAYATGILAVTVLALAQSDAPAPSFEAADVHASPHGVREGGLYVHANRLELHGITMLHLITTAYDVKEDKVFGGPNWLDTDRFEVIAKSARAINAQTFRPMLQALLAERFQLRIRKEDKPQPVFALIPTKHVLLKKSAAEGEPQCKRTNEDGYMTLTCQHVTMTYLAGLLPGTAPNYFSHPVVDQTGLSGAYDVKLQWTGRGQLGGGDPDHPGISLFNYFEKQLGLKVEQQTRPAESLVIESVNEKPSANPPGTAEKLPPPVAEFEVAEVRPSKPDTKPDYRMKNGRIEAMGLTMKQLIGFAYDLDDYMLPGGEKWLETDHFDIIAKTDPSVTDGTLEAMLRTLLAERFHLKCHFEEQPVSVWALTAPKGQGKLRTSAGEEHAGCTRTPGDGVFTYSCRNTTMAQFADKMPTVGGIINYLYEHPVVDLTGLSGSYDFEIVWSPPARVYGRGGRGDGAAPPSAMPTASAPTGGLTIFEAIAKLGLKLSVEKHSMPVVVIDHVDRTPDN